MLLRAQFNGLEFRKLLRFRTASMTRPCPQLYFEASNLFLTRVQFLEVTEIFSGPPRTVAYPNNGPQEAVFQGTRIGLKLKFRVTASQLDASDDPVPFADQEGNATIALDLRVQNGADSLVIEVLETDFDTILALVGVGKAEMSNLLAAGVTDLGLLSQISDISKALKDFASVRHIDAGYNPANDRVEIRIEVSTGTPSAGMFDLWTQFYANAFDDLTGGAGWGLFFDQRIGASLMNRSITAEIDASSEFRRDGAVSVFWNAAAPGYHASVEGEVIDACQCLWGQIDLDVRVWMDLNFSLTGNKLRTDLWFDHKITDVAEAACCVITTSLLFPIFGVVMLFNGQLKWYEFLGGVLLSPFPLEALVVAIARYSQASVPLQFCIKDPGNDNHFTCEFELPPLRDSAGCMSAELSLVAEHISGRPDGLALTGRLDAPEIVDPLIGIDQVTPLKYVKPTFGCSGGKSGDNFSTEFRVFRQSGNYDFDVCQVHVLGPFKYAAVVEITRMKCPYTAWVKVSIGFSQYDYSDIKVLVVTTAGAVHVTLAAAAQVSGQKRAEAIQAGLLQRVSVCYAKSKRWDVRWLIDPAPYIGVIQTRQIWTLTGIASEQSGRVTVVDEKENAIATLDTSKGRAMRISVAHAGASISVIQESEDRDDLQSSGWQAVQALMGVERAIGFRTPILAVDPVRMSPVRLVVVHERDKLTLLRVEDGDLVEAGVIDVGGMAWIGRQGKTLYAGAEQQLLALDLAENVLRWRDMLPAPPSMRGADCGCSGKPARDAEASIAALPAPAQFDFLVRRDGSSPNERGVWMESARWGEEEEGVSVTALLRRPVCGGGRVHLPRAVSSLMRIAGETYVALSKDRREVEVLRTLHRLQP